MVFVSFRKIYVSRGLIQALTDLILLEVKTQTQSFEGYLQNYKTILSILWCVINEYFYLKKK